MARQERPGDGTHNHQPTGPAAKRWPGVASHRGVGRRGHVGSLLGPHRRGFLLRLGNDPALNVPDQLFQRVVWGAWPTIGAVIVARQPRNRIGWLCCAVGLVVGPGFFGQDYAWYALVHRPGSLPGGLAMGWLGKWPWYIALVLILVFLPLLFPNGQLVSQRWRPVAWAAAAWLVPVWIWAAFSPGPLAGTGIATVPNPLGPQGTEAAFKLLQTILAAGVGLLMILSAASMVARFQRARAQSASSSSGSPSPPR
jgi:hypothetical protein